MLIDDVIDGLFRERSALEISFDILERKTVLDVGSLLATPVVDATNVMEYVYLQDPKEKWTLADVVNMAPPFARLWLEFASPRKANSGGVIVEHNFWNVRKAAAHLVSGQR